MVKSGLRELYYRKLVGLFNSLEIIELLKVGLDISDPVLWRESWGTEWGYKPKAWMLDVEKFVGR